MRYRCHSASALIICSMRDTSGAARLCVRTPSGGDARRIAADYPIANGADVFHIMGKGRVAPAHLTVGAVIQPDGTVVYPPAR
jgi:hypothetical protein